MPMGYIALATWGLQNLFEQGTESTMVRKWAGMAP